MKETITLDFDGVVHAYTSPWVSADKIPDGPVEGAIEWILTALQKYDIAIFSARSSQPEGIVAMQGWLRRELVKWLRGSSSLQEIQRRIDISGYQEEGGDERYSLLTWTDGIINAIKWPMTKIPSKLYIDDNAYRFDGQWPSIDTISSLQSWTEE